MSTFDDFISRFDEEGRFLDGDGLVDVVFAIRSGKRFPGQLHFRDGLCVRAAMDGGGDWGLPDGSPIPGVSFLLDFSDGPVHEAVIDQGRVRPVEPSARPPAKRDFLANLRVARNLFVHSQPAGTNGGILDAPAVANGVRAAIWITPKSVAGFDAACFPELEPERRTKLQTAVQDFLAAAKQVKAKEDPTPEQYGEATAAFHKILTILHPYLLIPDEAEKVETALRGVPFPSWVVNWDYELGSDQDGGPSVWVNLFVEEGAPTNEFGRFALRVIPTLREALSDEGVDRWPYVRLRSAAQYRTA